MKATNIVLVIVALLLNKIVRYPRAEWLLSVNGAFKQGFPVVTIYTNLGEDAVIHGLEETEVREGGDIGL